MKLVNRAEAKMFGNTVFFVEWQKDSKKHYIIAMEYSGDDKFKPVVAEADNDKDADAQFRTAIANQLIKHHVNDIKLNVKAWE